MKILQQKRTKRWAAGLVAAALCGFCLTPARAASPAVVVAYLGTFISSVTGTVSMTTSLMNYRGDYEEQRTQVVVRRYEDRCSSLYRGVYTLRIRTYWVDFNGAGHYRIWLYQRHADGRELQQQASIWFEHAFEQRNYFCSPTPGVWFSVISRCDLGIGYEVPKAANLAQHTAPNPMKVSLKWRLSSLHGGCEYEKPRVWEVTTEADAPRRGHAPLPIPATNVQVDRIEITARMR